MCLNISVCKVSRDATLCSGTRLTWAALLDQSPSRNPMHPTRTVLLIVAVSISVSVAARAQEAPKATAQTIVADSADVESVDAIVAALYDVISGPAGEIVTGGVSPPGTSSHIPSIKLVRD